VSCHPLQQLVTRKGECPQKGKKLYFGVATCSQCHMVGTEGKNVGPSLTEIGSKLTKEAMYVSIVSPSSWASAITMNHLQFGPMTMKL
jgi:putative heme-binding domain-containing protein